MAIAQISRSCRAVRGVLQQWVSACLVEQAQAFSKLSGRGGLVACSDQVGYH